MTWMNKFKLNVFNAFREVGLVGVLIDPTCPGVTVHEGLRGVSRILLHFGENLPKPILDLEVDTEGIKATLSFERVDCKVVLPWDSVMVVGLVQTEIFCQFQNPSVAVSTPVVPENKSEVTPGPKPGRLFTLIPGGMGNN